MGEYLLKEASGRAIRIKNLAVLTERLISMMRDYNITLKQAVMWDMEGFDNYNPKIAAHIQHYLLVNGVNNVDDRLFYIKIVKGLSPDIVLSHLESDERDTPRNL